MKHKEKKEKEDQSVSISSSSGSRAGHDLEERMICISCWQSDSKLTCLNPQPLSSSIAQQDTLSPHVAVSSNVYICPDP
ncbi:hypothetical protein DY000_02029512 [Brassica cretica]|uniref:Uncharacterized protein n=1 Tax=Brassica cretica TaxID=69181 RepID=A0ABQ7DG91_BRACR|nr:hypothetical protein DY000_02029512 [Brassica cretica]